MSDSGNQQREMAHATYNAYWESLARNSGEHAAVRPAADQFYQLPIQVRNAWQHAALAAGKAFLNAIVAESDRMINVSSVYGHETSKPYVQVQWGQSLAQLDPDSARQLARDLLDAASISETDAFLVMFFQKQVGVDRPDVIAGILAEFRKWRKELT